MCHIAEMLRKHKGFTSIDLSDNRIPPSGAVALGRAICENKVLEVLNLDHNELGDEGIISIANALTVNTTLRYCFIAVRERAKFSLL